MMGGGGYGERKTLADMILEKIELKEAEKRGEVVVDTDEGEMMDLPPKVVEVSFFGHPHNQVHTQSNGWPCVS